MNKKILIGTVISVIVVAFAIHFFLSSYSIVKKDESQQKLDKQSTANEQTPPQSVAGSLQKEKPNTVSNITQEGLAVSNNKNNSIHKTTPLPAPIAAGKSDINNLPPPLVQKNNDDTPPKPRPVRPPDMDKPEPPASLLEQINRFVAESKRTAGPEADTLGKQLLESTNALLQVAGMAVLAENNILTDDNIKQIADSDDLSVAVNSLGWLFDTGRSEYAEKLNSALGSKNISTDDALKLMASGELNSSGARVILDMLADDMSAEEAKVIYQDISNDDSYEYSVRMKALLKLRDEMSFSDFRDTVRSAQNGISDNDELWKEGVSRLSEKLDGPVAVHTGPETITPSNIDEMLAREYPMTLEDMAQKLEHIVANEDSYIQHGTAERLNKRLAELKERPWSDAQQISLTRIEVIAANLAKLEKPDTEAPSSMVTPPPGAEE